MLCDICVNDKSMHRELGLGLQSDFIVTGAEVCLYLKLQTGVRWRKIVVKNTSSGRNSRCAMPW